MRGLMFSEMFGVIKLFSAGLTTVLVSRHDNSSWEIQHLFSGYARDALH
jgi:hypothetical protein